MSRKKFNFRVVATLLLGLALPPLIWLGTTALLTDFELARTWMFLDPDGNGATRRGPVGAFVWFVVGLISPLCGYGVIARRFRRWRELDGGPFAIVASSVAYWTVYAPFVWLRLIIIGLGLSGGI